MTTLTEGSHPAEFVMSEGNGMISRDTVTVVSGAGVIKAGTVLGVITASGKYKTALLASSDGSEAAAAIALYDVDATSADAKVVVIARDAEVNMNMLIYGADINTSPEKVAANAQLAAKGIIVRT